MKTERTSDTSVRIYARVHGDDGERACRYALQQGAPV
jgi:hypothetical protein